MDDRTYRNHGMWLVGVCGILLLGFMALLGAWASTSFAAVGGAVMMLALTVPALWCVWMRPAVVLTQHGVLVRNPIVEKFLRWEDISGVASDGRGVYLYTAASTTPLRVWASFQCLSRNYVDHHTNKVEDALRRRITSHVS